MTESLSVVLDGASSLTANCPIQRFSLRASDTAQASLKSLKCQSASIALDGHCGLKAAGSVDSVSISASGSARADCEKLDSRSAGIEADGHAGVSLGRVDVLSAAASGNAAIRYKGKPSSISRHSEDNGSIT
jgi:hypothetical protein